MASHLFVAPVEAVASTRWVTVPAGPASRVRPAIGPRYHRCVPAPAGGPGRSQGVSEAAAAVAPGPDLDLLMAGQGHEPCQRPRREAAVEPAGAYQHRDARGRDRRPASGGRGGLPVKPGEPVITERH